MSAYNKIIKEVVSAIAPMGIVVLLLLITIVQAPLAMIFQFLAGMAFVLIGLFLFLLGAEIGLLPLGRLLGNELPGRGSITFFLAAAFGLGFIVTFAEPDVRVLSSQVEQVSAGAISQLTLVLAVALGVALFVAIAMLRIVLNVPIKRVLSVGYLLVIVLSMFTPAHFLPISFDAGGVTTGPMTVPFILSLGVGTTAVLQGRSSLGDSFGLIGLASLGPILSVMLLGVLIG